MPCCLFSSLALLVLLPETGRKGGNLLSSVTEVHFEWRVAHHKVELAKALPIVALVVRCNKCVALDGMVK